MHGQTQWELEQRENVREYERSHTITELKNTLQGFNIRSDETDRQFVRQSTRTHPTE